MGYVHEITAEHSLFPDMPTWCLRNLQVMHNILMTDSFESEQHSHFI